MSRVQLLRSPSLPTASISLRHVSQMCMCGRQITSVWSRGNIKLIIVIGATWTHGSVFFRHTSRQAGTIITSLAWCPRKNHLAWTDNNGEFFQWHKPIADGQPDPVKVINTSASKSKVGLDLFGEEPVDAGAPTLALDQNVDAEVEPEDDYDNWIVDDLGDGMQDKPTVGIKGSDGYVKEMGE
jgi:hypothetical protein